MTHMQKAPLVVSVQWNGVGLSLVVFVEQIFEGNLSHQHQLGILDVLDCDVACSNFK